MTTSKITTTIKVLEIEDKPMVATAVPPSLDSATITLATFSKMLETAESDLYEKKAFVQTVSKELSKNPPEMSIMLHKLLQRGFLDEVLEASDFTVWNMFALNARVSQAILKFIFANYAAETSVALRDYVVLLKFNDFHVKQFVNFYAIRNMALKIIDVDACVLLCKQYGVLPELLDNLLLVWSDPTFIESGSVDYHRRISFALASIARIGESEKEIHPLDLKRFVPKFLAGVPLYLEATRDIVREMGMIMADTLAQLLTPATKLNLMKSSSPFLELILKVTKGPPVSKDLGLELLVRPVPPPIIKYETRILPKSEEFLPIAAKDKSPRYLLQCMKLLQSNEPEKMSSALPNLNELILKASKLELLDNLPELPKLLLSLHDNFDLPNFDQYLSNSILSLILRIPTPTIQILSTGFYEKETNLYSQTRILRACMAIVLMYVQNEENPNNLNTIHHLSRSFGESLLKPLKNSAAIYDKIFRSAIFIPIAQMLIKDLCIFARLSGDRFLLLETCSFILSFKDRLTFKEELRVGIKWLVEGFQAKQIMSPEFMELLEFGKILYNFKIHSV